MRFYRRLALSPVLLSFLAFLHCQGGVQQKNDLKLKRFQALDGRVSLLAPANFKWMSKEMIPVKYPRSSNPPEEVLTNEKATVNVAFNINKHGVRFTHYPQFQQILTHAFESQFGNIKWIRNEIQEIGTQKFIILELVTPAADTDIYNMMMFTTNSEKKNIMISFNCLLKDRGQWQDIAHRIRDSITVR